MGVPTSEVGYIPAMPKREDHEVHKDMWWHWGGIGRVGFDQIISILTKPSGVFY